MVTLDQLRYLVKRPMKFMGEEYHAGDLLPEGGDPWAIRHMVGSGLVEKVLPAAGKEAPKPEPQPEPVAQVAPVEEPAAEPVDDTPPAATTERTSRRGRAREE